MATTADADLILKLYDLRREATLRKARHFLAFEFAPKTFEEFMAVASGAGKDEQAYWRQATSYWELAASVVLRGAVDSDLYFDSNGEGLFLYAKFRPFAGEYQKRTGFPLMKQTGMLLERFPAAKERFDRIVAVVAAREAKA